MAMAWLRLAKLARVEIGVETIASPKVQRVNEQTDPKGRKSKEAVSSHRVAPLTASVF
jgi:hypothetical protein